MELLAICLSLLTFQVIEALKICNEQGKAVTVVCTGSTYDGRDEAFFPLLLAKISLACVRNQFVILGLVPRQDVFSLLKESTALLQPSLYEGWSSSVEEAKCLGKTVILSDILVHREQAPEKSIFFDPFNPIHLASRLIECMAEPEDARPQAAILLSRYKKNFAEFGDNFVRIAGEACNLMAVSDSHEQYSS